MLVTSTNLILYFIYNNSINFLEGASFTYIYLLGIYIYIWSIIYLILNVNHFLLFIIYMELTLMGALLVFVSGSVHYGIGALLVYSLLILVVAAVETAVGLSLAVSHVNAGCDLSTSKLTVCLDSRS